MHSPFIRIYFAGVVGKTTGDEQIPKLMTPLFEEQDDARLVLDGINVSDYATLVVVRPYLAYSTYDVQQMFADISEISYDDLELEHTLSEEDFTQSIIDSLVYSVSGEYWQSLIGAWSQVSPEIAQQQPSSEMWFETSKGNVVRIVAENSSTFSDVHFMVGPYFSKEGKRYKKEFKFFNDWNSEEDRKAFFDYLLNLFTTF